MAGFRTFATGEVLTAANVNDFLMKQSVMVFADATARTAALGTEVTEGMLTFNKDTGQLEVFDGTDFVEAGGAGEGLDSRVVITATNTGFVIPALANPIVMVTVIGGGGGGSGSGNDLTKGAAGGTGGTSTFSASGAGSVSAVGGLGGVVPVIDGATGRTGSAGFSAGNGGGGGGYGFGRNTTSAGINGNGGRIAVGYMDLTGLTTASATVGGGGGGGAGSNGAGGPGGRGEIILQFKAG